MQLTPSSPKPSSPKPSGPRPGAEADHDAQREAHRRAAPDRGRTLLGPALALIHTGQTPTRSALTRALDVTRATAGAVTAELEALGLITVDSRPAGGGRGRPSHRLAVDPEGPVVIAGQIHADGLSVTLAGLGGLLEPPVHQPLPAATDPVRMLRAVAEAGAELARNSSRRCLGAALALPNPVTEPDGTALAALHFAWPSGTPVADLYDVEVGRADNGPRALDPLPTAIANDANLGALAEYRHGAGRGARHLLLVTSGHRGVGGALVIDGRLHTGSAGLALEVGHLTVDPQGGPASAATGAASTPRPTRTPCSPPPGSPPTRTGRCSTRPANSAAPLPPTSAPGPPSSTSSTGLASGWPASPTSSTPTGWCSAGSTSTCWRPPPSGCARWSPSAASGGAAAGCRSSARSWRTARWPVRRNSPGGRTWRTRSRWRRGCSPPPRRRPGRGVVWPLCGSAALRLGGSAVRRRWAAGRGPAGR